MAAALGRTLTRTLSSARNVPKLNPVQQTSLLVAYCRACERKRTTSPPLCDDYLAERLCNALFAPEARDVLETSAFKADGVELLAVRTRILDDWLENVAKRPRSQVVLLGAGMDTRAYRLALDGSVVFEVDMDRKVLEAKHAVLADSGASPRTNPVLVQADCSQHAALAAALEAAGLRTDAPIHWVCEGLIEYLCPTVHRELYAMAARVSARAPGSTLAVQVLTPDWGQRLQELGMTLPYRRLASVATTIDELRWAGWQSPITYDQAAFRRMYGRTPNGGFHMTFAELDSAAPAPVLTEL
jgi:methyltransferase (TIGR00027 family)